MIHTVSQRGVSNPAAKLHVETTGSADVARFFRPNSSTNEATTIHLGRNAATNDTAQLRYVYGGSTNNSNSRIDLGFYGNGSILNVTAACNVGINQTSPSYKLDVSGDIRMVGKCIVQTNNNANGIVCTGTGGGSSYFAHRNGDPGIKLTRTSVWGGEDMEYTLALLPAPGGTPRGNSEDLGSSSHYWRRTYTAEIYRSNEYGLSDDRIKTNETLVENATETLLKLKPQTYDKHLFEFDKFTEEEYSNVSSDNTVFSAHSNCWADQTELIENTIDEAEQFPYIRRRLTEHAQKETGLILSLIHI